MGNPLFAIENQQNQLVTYGFIRTARTWIQFSRFSPKIAVKTKIVRISQVRCPLRLIRSLHANLKSDIFFDLRCKF